MSSQTFFENEFVTITAEPEGYLSLCWKPETRRMIVEEYKHCVNKYAEAIEQLQQACFFIDTRNFYFAIPPKI